MNTNTTAVVAVVALVVVVALFVLFGGGAMSGWRTGGGMMGSAWMGGPGSNWMGGSGWMWIPAVLTVGLGVLLVRGIFGKKP